MAKVKTKKLRTFKGELRRIKRQVPWMISKTLNDMAFDMRGNTYPDEIRGDLVLSKQGGLRSIKAVKSTARNLSATVGSNAKFLHIQEFGEDIETKGKHGVPLPASSAARRRPGKRARGKNKLKNIQLTKIRSGAGRGEAIRKARAMGGTRYIRFKSRKGYQGIFRINGNRRPTKVWDLSKKMVRIKPQHMMRDASERTGKKGQRMMKKHLVREVLYSARKLRSR